MSTDAPRTPPRARLAAQTSPYLRALRVPVLFVIVALGLLAAYYSLYVGNNDAYLAGRNLRLIAKLGSQIETAFADHEAVLSSFSTYYGADRFQDGFRCITAMAGPFVPMFGYVSLETQANGQAETSEQCDQLRRFQRPGGVLTPSSTAVVFTEDVGVTWTRRSAAGGGTRPAVPFRVVMRDVVTPSFSHTVDQGVFDSALLATTTGRVVHQEGAPELRLTTLNRLLRTQADGTPKGLDFGTLPMTAQVLEVEISGGRYLMYVQPCCAQLAGGGGPDGSAGLMVAGLVDARRSRAASMAVSFSIMALMAAGILAGIFSWPFVKVLLIGEGQRLRLIDALLVGLCGLLWTTLITVAALDWHAYGSLKADIDQQLKALSGRIRENIREELTLAVDQLEFLDRWAGTQSTSDDRTEELLTRLDEAPGYPLLESFALIDRDGMQVRKWAVAKFTTPRVSTRRREYFRHWASPHPADPPYFLESIRSVTTGSKEAVLSKPTTGHGDAAMVAAMTIPMISLTAPVLPPGFGFAVIDEEGQVLFHSDSTQRLDERLFLETDRHRRLRAAAAARHAELMNVRYFGEDYRFYITPLEHPARASWSLITFADKEPARTINIEWLVTTWLFALIYISVYVLLCIFILVLRPSYRASWLWPDVAREGLYQQLIGSYSLFVAAFGVAIYSFRDQHLLLVAGLFPFIVWTATYLALVKRRDVAQLRRVGLGTAGLGAAALLFWLLRSDVASATVVAVLVALACGTLLIDSRPRLRHAYVAAGVFLLVLTGVLPTLAFFKVAHAIQVESFIKYEQLLMARQLRVRTVAGGRDPASLTSTDVAQRVSDARRRLSVYDRFFFDTERCDPGAAPSVSRSAPLTGELPKPIEDLLPYYSEASVGMRELLHDRSSDDAWQWHRSGSRLVLHTPATTSTETLCLQSSVPRLFSPGSGGWSDSASRIAKALVLLGVVLLAVHWIVRFIARRIFLIDLVGPLWVPSRTSIPMYPGSNLFIRWRAADRKAQPLPVGGGCLVDLAQCPAGEAGDWFTAQQERLEQCPPGETVVIDHVERGQSDPGFAARTLTLITDVLDVQHRTVVLVSALRLETLLRGDGGSQASSATVPPAVGWAPTLRRFTVVDPRFERTDDVEDSDPVVGSVWAEVRRAATERRASIPLNDEQLYEEVGDRLDNYYQGLWASCSDAEKLVLEHLARERLLNEKDRRTVRVLMARRLIRKSPSFEIVDETFRRFVLSRAVSNEIAQIEHRSGSAWDTIRLPFMAALVATSAFFFLTQRELFTTTIAVVTALAGGIPAVVRVVGLFDGGSSRSREA